MLWGRGLAYSNKYRCILAQEILRESSISSEGRLLIFLLRQHPTNYFIVVNYYKADIKHTLVIGLTLFRLRTFHLRAIHLLGISPFPGFSFWNPRNHGVRRFRPRTIRPRTISPTDDSFHGLFVPNSTRMLFNCLLEAGMIK